jgi:hypothetical protein
MRLARRHPANQPAVFWIDLQVTSHANSFPQSEAIHRQHDRVQKKDRPEISKITVSNKSDVAGDGEGAERCHAFCAEGGEN